MTNHYQSKTQAIVMQRIHRIQAMRVFLAPLVFSVCVLVFALWGVGREVWVARVFQNMPAPSPAHIQAFIHFFAEAFFTTRFVVQVLILAIVVAAVWLTYNVAQLLRLQAFGIS